MADEDLWHVRIAPDEVKILSLEKLDDLFRLDVIDGDALVWQPGMDEWLPLSVVAGMGDDEPEVVELSVSEPPPRPIGATTATAWPPQAVPNQTLNAWPPQSAPPPPSSRSMLEPPSARMPQQVRLPPLSAPPARAADSVAPLPHPGRTGSVAPLPHPGRTGSVAPLPHPGRSLPPSAHSASSWPPPAAWEDPAPSPFATTVAAGAGAAEFPLYAESKPRSAIPTDVRIRHRSGGGGGTWVVVVALAAGAAVTLYRNAMVHAAAKSMGQETAYLNLETALGGPSFGTPRAVEKMSESSRALLESLAAASTPTPGAASTAAFTGTSSPATTAAPLATAAPAEDKKAEDTTAAAKPVAASAPDPTPARPAAASGATRPVSATAPRSPAASKEPAPVFKAPKKGKKGNEYDPLNPNL
jgi:hypothetical protein